MTSQFYQLLGLTADKFGSYEPAFYMAGGTYIAASLIPCVLHCVNGRKTTRKELSPNDKENTEDAQEIEGIPNHDTFYTGSPSKTTNTCRNPVVLGNELFVSTV